MTGRGAVLLIEGPPGIGKSRLLSAAEGIAEHRGIGVAPFGELSGAVGPAPLFAGLGMASPAGRRHRGSSDRGTVLADIGDFAVRTAERVAASPTLITVDDAQCAETTTLEALRALPVWLAAYPVSWIIARRTGVPDPAAWLFDELEGLGAARAVLGSLSAEAIAQIVSDRLGARPDGELLARASVAGGNPQLVGALLEVVHDEHEATIAGGRARMSAGRPSAPVDEVIHDWVTRLSPAARHLLDLAASLDPEFAVDDLAELLGWAPDDVRGPVAELMAADLLCVAGDDVLVFQHDLVREWVAGQLPAALRRTLRSQVTGRCRPHGLRSAWASLTETERTVAELVATGLTNREVADRIFLSPHTVSFHLRKVYRKLGIGSRVELTRLSIENE